MADGKVVYEIRGDNSKFQSDVNQTENIAKEKSSAIGGFAKGAVVAVGAAIATAGAGIISFSKDAIGAGSQFDTAMSQVAATMGTSVDQIQDLSNFAMDMGATTAFSANEAADALNYMALAGYDAETSMKMLPNVLNLAAAGGFSLSRASDMVTDAQSALGLSLDQTSEMVDKMAKASSKSNTSVEQLGDAFLTVGGTAKNLKGGTTELATVLGVLADNGIKGSEGGTALRNVILSLSAPTDTAAKKLEELGVTAYDADGNMRALPEVFDDLNKSMEGMTQGEKTEVLNTIFNKVDLKSANALLATSQERFNELSGAIDNASGAAQQMADTQLDNLNGDITLMKSALEGAKITLSNKLTPTLRKFVQFGTKEIGKLDNAFKRGGIDGFADQLGKSLGKAVTKLTQYVPKFISVAGKLALSLIETLLKSLSTNFPKILKAGGELAKKLASGLQDAIPRLFETVGDLIGQIIANTPKLIEYGLKIAVGLVKGILQGIPKLVTGVWEGIKGLFSEPISEDVQIAQKELEELQESLKDVGKETEEMQNGFKDADASARMAEYWLDIFDRLKDKTNKTAGEEVLLKKAIDELNKVLPETQKIVQTETGEWIANTKEIKNNIDAMKLRAKAEVYYDKIQAASETLVDLEEQLGEKQAVYNDLVTNRDGIKTTYDRISALTKEAERIDKNGHNVQTQWYEASDALREYAEAAGITEEKFLGWSEVIGWLIQDELALESQLDDANKQVETQGDIVATLEKGIEDVNKEIEHFSEKAGELEEEAAKVGEAIPNGLILGMNRQKPLIAKTAGDLSRLAISTMKSVAQIASPSKKARKEVGEQIGEGEVLGLKDKIPDVAKASEELINAIDLNPVMPDAPRGSIDISGDSAEMRSILAVLNQMLPRIGQNIVLDTGELVGATVGKYDASLGQLQKRRARYE